MERRKPGPPSKGPREVIFVRVPPQLAAALRERAAATGRTVNDYVGELAAAATGVPYAAQVGLPMTA